MVIRGKRTYGVMAIIGIIGLLKAFGVMPDVLTDQVFAGIEATLLGVGGMTMRAGVASDSKKQ